MASSKTLIVGVAVLFAGQLHAQTPETAPVGTQVTRWFEAEGLEPGSASIVDRASLGGGTEVVIAAQRGYGRRARYVLLVIPSEPSIQAWKVSDISTDQGRPGIEYADDERVIVRAIYLYRETFTPYELNLETRSAIPGEWYEHPTASSILLSGDTLYAQYATSWRPADLLVQHPIGAERSTVISLTGDSSARPLESVSGDIPPMRLSKEGVVVNRASDTIFIPLDLPDYERLISARPRRSDDRYPVDVRVELGPVVSVDGEYWVGLSFYDGEGTSGVGGLVRLDVEGGVGEVLYLPELTEWSVSALHWDGERLIFARKRRPEGFERGGGLGFYDPESGEVESIDVPGVVGAITSDGVTTFGASTSGVFSISGGRVIQFKLVPSPSGWLLIRFPTVPE